MRKGKETPCQKTETVTRTARGCNLPVVWKLYTRTTYKSDFFKGLGVGKFQVLIIWSFANTTHEWEVSAGSKQTEGP